MWKNALGVLLLYLQSSTFSDPSHKTNSKASSFTCLIFSQTKIPPWPVVHLKDKTLHYNSACTKSGRGTDRSSRKQLLCTQSEVMAITPYFVLCLFVGLFGSTKSLSWTSPHHGLSHQAPYQFQDKQEQEFMSTPVIRFYVIFSLHMWFDF